MNFRQMGGACAGAEWSRCPRWLVVLALIMFGQEVLAADGAATEQDSVAGFLDAWFATSDAAKEAQPHWMTPVVTVTPRLEQEYRYDQT